MRAQPRVVLVGGPDVDARIDLMRCLSHSFEISALGSTPGLRDRFARAGFEYSSFPMVRNVNPIMDLYTVVELTRYFRYVRPDLVHTFDSKPGVWGCWAAHCAGVPVIINTVTGLGSLYGDDHWRLRLTRKIFETLQRTACRLATQTIFQNHDDARQYLRTKVASPAKCRVVLGSGVACSAMDSERISEVQKARLRAELGLKTNDVVVTMVSRVIRSKGVLEFMAAAHNLQASRPSVRFVLIGPIDEESPDRLDTVQVEMLRRTLIWPGARQDIATILAASDIFVLPSAYREGIPRVLLEAASMGLPIVTTDSPGCNEVVDHGENGLLVPIGNPPALRRAIQVLIDEPTLRVRFGRISRQRALERFDLRVIANQIRAIYRELLTRKRITSPMDSETDTRMPVQRVKERAELVHQNFGGQR